MRKLKLLTLILLLGTAVAAAAPRPESPVDRTAAAPDPMAAETSDIADAEPPLTAEPLPATDVAPVSEAPDGPTATTPAGDRAAGLTAIADGEQPQSAKTVNQRRAERGISSRTSLFVPKGQWVFGGTVSYSTHNNRDYDVLVIDDITSEGYTFKVSPMIGYALGNNSTLGVRFIYGRTLLKLDGTMAQVNPFVGYFYRDNNMVGLRLGYRHIGMGLGNLEVDLGSQNDLDISLDNMDYSGNAYSFGLFHRSYTGIDPKGSFGLFAELELSGMIGRSDFSYLSGDTPKSTHSKSFKMNISFNPGVAVYIFPNVCGTLSFGLGGFQYSKIDQTDQDGKTGSRTASKMRFRLNLANINVGMTVHLWNKKKE